MKKLQILILLLTQALWVFGQAGENDSSFNPEPNTGTNGGIQAVAIQSDGKILIGGLFNSYNGIGTNDRIARINLDGNLDPDFYHLPNFLAAGSISTIALQSDNKIVIGGGFTSFSGIPINRVARLNPDGTIDNSFNIGFGANNDVSTLAIQGDNKILIAGNFTFVDGVEIGRIARLNQDGTLDPTFNAGIGANGNIESLVIQNDGKILIAGDFTLFDGIEFNRIVRLNSDGSIDESFDIGTGANFRVRSLALQPDGKILIGGIFFSINGVRRDGIARLNPNGSLDLTFTVGGGVNSSLFDFIIQPDNKIIIAGNFTSYNGIVRNRLARVNSDGSLDLSFNSGIGPNNVIRAMALQVDGKILIGGSFTSYSGISRGRVARVLNDIDPCESNTAPEITTITGPESPLPLGSDALAEVDFSDENISSITWKIFDGNTVIQKFTDEVTGNKASRTFQNLPTGVFSILVELEDECGEKAIGQFDYVVVYDPDGGFVTGGGWIISPEGAYVEDLTLTGRANFGFVAKYKKGKSDAHQVDGNTEFQFRAADLNFKSSSHDDMSLVVINHKAIYKGKGSINGQAGYAFMVSAIDGDKLSNPDSDRFRIKIWSENSGQVIYDNQMNTAENADPSTAIEGGSIVIHDPTRGNQNKRLETELEDLDQINKSLFDQLLDRKFDSKDLIIYPNPASSSANIRVKLDGLSEVGISVFDAAGRLIYSEEGRQENSFTRRIPLEGLSSGIYHVVVKINHQYIQGRLIKQ